jgi:hypothetical protein
MRPGHTPRLSSGSEGVKDRDHALQHCRLVTETEVLLSYQVEHLADVRL